MKYVKHSCIKVIEAHTKQVQRAIIGISAEKWNFMFGESRHRHINRIGIFYTQHSGQTSGMRERNNSDRPANFPRKILKENIKNGHCLAK